MIMLSNIQVFYTQIMDKYFAFDTHAHLQFSMCVRNRTIFLKIYKSCLEIVLFSARNVNPEGERGLRDW
jgi:hypothetical protein